MSSSTVSLSPDTLAMPRTRAAVRDGLQPSVPWYIWTGVAGVTSAMVGGSWDVAWHRTIGRDSFWTPAHLLIQLCGVLAAIVGVWLVYQCTFRTDSPLRSASVGIFGLRAPLGVFLGCECCRGAAFRG